MSYIVPRDKPKRCTQPKCRFMDRNTLDCRLQCKSWESFEEQYEHCPLIEIPTPHGRLIDADATCNDLATVDPRYETMIDWCIRVIEAQQTVIEAED